jgi:GH15 family glucan-1,4-alpha-glucosidase
MFVNSAPEEEVAQMNEYPLIADHGLIGDLQTAALVATGGTLDWFCSPRFDSPSIFASLLDHVRGGHFSTRPLDEAFATKQLYLPDTAILITRFLTEEGVGELLDFMPRTGASPSEEHRLVRLLRRVRGRISFDIEVALRFDYGRQTHQLSVSGDGAIFDAGECRLTLSLIREQGTNGWAGMTPRRKAACVSLWVFRRARCGASSWRRGRILRHGWCLRRRPSGCSTTRRTSSTTG